MSQPRYEFRPYGVSLQLDRAVIEADPLCREMGGGDPFRGLARICASTGAQLSVPPDVYEHLTGEAADIGGAGTDPNG